MDPNVQLVLMGISLVLAHVYNEKLIDSITRIAQDVLCIVSKLIDSVTRIVLKVLGIISKAIGQKKETK